MVGRRRRKGRGVLLGAVALVVATMAMALPAQAAPGAAVLAFKTVEVGSPGNQAVGIIPFKDEMYANCAAAPPPNPEKPRAPKCMEVGDVGYRYGIGQLEVTVAQYVAFLNTVDPQGTNRHRLYSHTESGNAWPRFGQIDFKRRALPGRHYSLAAPEWANKPYGFANFLRSARFANSLFNGKVIAKQKSSAGNFKYVTYRVRLSPRTERGMYDMSNPKTTRTAKAGFVIPSQDEWIKAAYYDPSGGGSFSYWKYPTNPGYVGGGMADGPLQASLDAEGNVSNAGAGHVAIFHSNEGSPKPPAPYWCPAGRSAEACGTANPFGIEPPVYEEAFQGSLGTVGTALATSPWGTLDQGGNAVEWTDTITPPPFGVKGKRVWRRLHGGVPNAPAYQLWITAVGLQPQDNSFFTATYPWLGMRIGVIGNLEKAR